MTIFGLIVVGFTLNGEGPVSDTQGLVFVLAQGPTAQRYFWDFADVTRLGSSVSNSIKISTRPGSKVFSLENNWQKSHTLTPSPSNKILF